MQDLPNNRNYPSITARQDAESRALVPYRGPVALAPKIAPVVVGPPAHIAPLPPLRRFKIGHRGLLSEAVERSRTTKKGSKRTTAPLVLIIIGLTTYLIAQQFMNR